MTIWHYIIIYFIDKSVLVENRPLIKFIQNYIQESSDVFSISSLLKISMTSFPAFTLLFVQKSPKTSLAYVIKKNYTVAWRYEFYFLVVKKQYFTREVTELVYKILFLPLENKIHIFAPLCNILYIFGTL